MCKKVFDLLIVLSVLWSSPTNGNHYDSANMRNQSVDDSTYMQEALNLAAIAYGQTRPNPIVGCVIVAENDGHPIVVGRGYHRRSGEAHAEVLALNDAGEYSNGATAYVSLEPCNHFGRTPPCTLSLIRHGIKRVVAGMVDPDPRVSGAGLETLRAHGVEVELISNTTIARLCREINAPFIYRVLNHRPYSLICCIPPMLSNSCNNSSSAQFTSEDTRRLYQLISYAAPEIDTIVLTGQQLVELRALDANLSFPGHLNVVVLLTNLTHITDAKQAACEDSMQRRWVIAVCSSTDYLQILSLQNPQFNLSASERVTVVHATRSVNDSHSYYGYNDDLHLRNFNNESDDNKIGSGSFQEFLSVHLGSNAVLSFSPATVPLNVEVGTVQGLLLAGVEQPTSGDSPLTEAEPFISHQIGKSRSILTALKGLRWLQSWSSSDIQDSNETVSRVLLSGNSHSRRVAWVRRCNLWSP